MIVCLWVGVVVLFYFLMDRLGRKQDVLKEKECNDITRSPSNYRSKKKKNPP